MSLRDILDKAGDMFMPKELAPFASFLAPMLVGPIGGFSGLGMGLGMGLGQLASAKMHSGKLDPFNALAVLGAGMTPEARAVRMRGRIDPSKGTLGQKLSGSISDYLSGTKFNESGLGSGIIRGLDPTRSMFKSTSGFNPLEGEAGYQRGFKTNYFESPTISEEMYNLQDANRLGEASRVYPQTDEVFETILEKDMALRYGDRAYAPEPTARVGDEDMPEFLGETGIDADKGNLTSKEYAEFLKSEDKQTFLDSLPRRDTGSQTFLGDAVEGISGALMPGFTDADNKFNFTKALTTVATATTLTQMMPMAEELKKQKELDRAEEAKIWKEWFNGYKRVSGRDYIDSPYPDPTLMEKYKQYMASGGRVGYNLGGIADTIEVAPGMPEGMQIDGRDGIFISQGVREKADDVPAMLSKNEFVLTADAMKGFDKMTGGSGDPRAAAKKMYEMMDQMEAIA